MQGNVSVLVVLRSGVTANLDQLSLIGKEAGVGLRDVLVTTGLEAEQATTRYRSSLKLVVVLADLPQSLIRKICESIRDCAIRVIVMCKEGSAELLEGVNGFFARTMDEVLTAISLPAQSTATATTA